MKIFIRADGGVSIGLGHVMRMLVLAEELRKTNEVIFICRSSSVNDETLNSKNENVFLPSDDKYKAGIEIIKENNFEVIKICESNVVENIIRWQEKYKSDMLITDSYDVNKEYFNKLKLHFRITGYVDDVNKCKMNVDFIINQNINAEDLNYMPNVNKNTKLFLGTKYSMIRKEFAAEKSRNEISDECENILLTLGGMDKDFNTLKILEQLLGFGIHIYVVVGKAFPEKLINILYELSKMHNNIKICENAKMSELMKKCHIAISSCGSTLYELCAMNIPTIGIVVADNQLEVALKMKEKNLIAETYLIDKIDYDDLKINLNNLIKNKDIRSKMIEKQKNTVNIDGAELLTEEINEL